MPDNNTCIGRRLIIDENGSRIINKPSIKRLLQQKSLLRFCGATDAMDARIVEEVGFEGVWISSFEIHASCRLPDADILTVSDYSQICNRIADRIDIPILMDGDAGGGSPINTIRMVREYEKNGAFGICIEDNKYPKRCSFYQSVSRELENPRMHAMKIKAACDNRTNKEFMIIARTESLIVGNTVEDAVYRASCYADAGADAILIHHKGKDVNPIFEFAEKFKKSIPLVCVPTTYNQVTEQELRDHGYSIVIYANYGIRASVKTMQQMLKKIAVHGTLSAANEDVVEMGEIFRLVGLEDLQRNEQKYSL